MFAYQGRVRHAVRGGRDLARTLARRGPSGRVALVRTHWWEHVKNFGDLLTPLLLPRFGVHPVTAPAATADLVGVGSLLQHLGPESRATLWGTGLVHDIPFPLPEVRALAVRGALTAERIGLTTTPALGDAGLLLPRLLRGGPALRRRSTLGVVPHYAHLADPEFQRLRDTLAPGDGHRLIDVRRGPLAVARDIAACERIVTSSLHGLIVADALGIPAVWMVGGVDLVGKEFKFHDHETVARPARERRVVMADLTTMEEAAGRAVPADTRAVEHAQDGLVRAGRRIVEVTPHRLVRGVELPAAVTPVLARPLP